MTESPMRFDRWFELLLRGEGYNRESRDSFKRGVDESLKPLIMKLVTGKVADEKSIHQLVKKSQMLDLVMWHPGASMPAKKNRHCLKTWLLVAERMVLEDPAEVARGYASDLCQVIVEATYGYGYKDSGPDRIRKVSVDDGASLKSLAAVCLFVSYAQRIQPDAVEEGRFKDEDNSVTRWARIRNRELDTYLRENPHEVHTVVTYVSERGLGDLDSDLEALKQYLKDKEHGALDRGWL